MSEKVRPFLSVAAPAYNEEDVIESIVRYWDEVLKDNGVHGEIVVTDDGSKDSTGEILDALKAQFAHLVVVHHEVNSGYGKALHTAISHSTGEHVVTIDSDGQFDLAEYPLLMRQMHEGKYDVVTGFRHKKQDSFVKVLADRMLNLIIRFGFGLKLKDTNCALKIFKGDIVRRINIEAKGYPTPTEILIKLNSLGYTIGEVGISHHERESGKSQLKTFQTAWRFLLFLIYLRLKITLYNVKIISEI